MNPLMLCHMLAAAIHGDVPMPSVPEGYVRGTCHYDGVLARGYTVVTDEDAKPSISSRYGDAPDVTSGDETIVTWSDIDRVRGLARDGIRMIVLVRQGDVTSVHVSTLPSVTQRGRTTR